MPEPDRDITTQHVIKNTTCYDFHFRASDWFAPSPTFFLLVYTFVWFSLMSITIRKPVKEHGAVDDALITSLQFRILTD